MRLNLRSLLVILGLCFMVAQVGAQAPTSPARVIIVSSDTVPAYAQAAEALSDSLVRQGIPRADILKTFVSDLVVRLHSDQSPRPSVFVALGSEATQVLVAGNAQAPVVSALIPQRSFERILRSAGKPMSARLSVIQLDQPMTRQLALLRLALPQAKRLAVLYGPESSDRSAGLRAVTAAYGLELHDAAVVQTEDLTVALPLVLNDSDLLLALADPLVYNSSTIQNILLTSFRARIPLVAFSAAYVRAGALLALYTTPVQAGNQAAEVVLGVLRGKPLPDRPVEPNDFEVGVNAHVARSLGLSLDGDYLRMALRRLEHLP